MNTETTFEAALAEILDTDASNALKRATGLRILPACGRCGGSGRYSWNQINGDVCFGCGGSGQQKPKASQQSAVIEAARASRLDGSFDSYIEMLRTRARVRKATDQVMAAWKATGISAQYDWRKAAEFSRTGNEAYRRDREIADINAKMAAAFETTQKASMLPKSTHPDYADRIRQLDETLSKSLSDIKDAAAELRQLMQEGDAA